MFTGQPGVGTLPWNQLAGNMVTIPGFGTITLAKLTVKHEDPIESDERLTRKTTFTLTMIDLNLGCVPSKEAYVDWWRHLQRNDSVP
jgi:hypothetical protein